MPKDLNGVEGATSEDRLRQYVDRILRLQAEQSELAADIREVRAEAKAAGYDTKALNEMVKLGKLDAMDRSEREAIRDLYRSTVFPEFGTVQKNGKKEESSLSGIVQNETPVPAHKEAAGGATPSPSTSAQPSADSPAEQEASTSVGQPVSGNADEDVRPTTSDTQGVAQPGSAPGLEPGGRRFESSRPDQSDDGLDIPTFMKRDANNRAPWMEGAG